MIEQLKTIREARPKKSRVGKSIPALNITSADRARFMSNVCVAGDGCWVWVGRIHSRGYGGWLYGRKHYRAHRFSYAVFNGAVPAGLVVMHKCDNPSCVNPEHLELGTQGQNMTDMMRKQRHKAARGSEQRSAKLTDTQVKGILTLVLKFGIPRAWIGKSLGMQQSSISQICSGRKWKHIPRDAYITKETS